jgi:glycerol-3-phosphate O-acyltransferase
MRTEGGTGSAPPKKADGIAPPPLIVRDTSAQRRVLEPHPTAMIEKPGRVLRWFFGWFFREIQFAPEMVERVRGAAERGTVVYVCKMLSYIEYLYFSYAFLRFGLPLSRFANGVKTLMHQPLGEIVRGLFRLWRDRHGSPVAELSRVIRAGAARATRRSCT